MMESLSVSEGIRSDETVMSMGHWNIKDEATARTYLDGAYLQGASALPG